MRFRMGKDCGPDGFPRRFVRDGFRRRSRLGQELELEWATLAMAAAAVVAGAVAAGCSRASELRLLLLRLIADEPRHGYDLIRAIEELSHGAYAPSPGVVYPTLTMLQDMGLIEEAKSEGARKVFQATAEGDAHLKEHERGGRRRCSSGSRSWAATTARPAVRRSSARSPACCPHSGIASPARMRTRT